MHSGWRAPTLQSLSESLQDIVPCGDLYVALRTPVSPQPRTSVGAGYTPMHPSSVPSSPPPLEAIAKLDTAIIVSGGAGEGRLDLILDIIQHIQSEHPHDTYAYDTAIVTPAAAAEAEGVSANAIPCLAAPPSLAAFQTRYHTAPFILRGFARDWPALTERPWASINYLRAVAGPGRVVPVEVGRDYRTDDWSQKIIPWDAFLESLDADDNAQPLYLAQHSLLMQFPALRADIEVPDYVYADVPRPPGCPPPQNDEQLVINAWFGPKGTVSPAHTDPYFNFYVQVNGQKTVWMAPPHCATGMYATGNTAGVDVFATDQSDHPKFATDVAGSSLVERLGPGDVLYMPVGWWHGMRAESRNAVVASTDRGATLVFLKQNLTDIGEEAAAELAGLGREGGTLVERIALGQNRLTTLPTAFALLSRLRYLNLKNNSFAVFPDVLTLLPALDTLDISHNKIKRLPTQPGKLLNLRVFCLSRNKLSRLPIYLSKFYKLEILQLERNPLEWPPKSVVTPPESPGAMRDWIRSVQKWIETAETSRSHIHDETPRVHDDSGFGEQELESKIEDSYNSWARFTPVTEREFDDGVTPHARSFSIDSNFSVSSIAESETDVRADSYGQAERPPPLHLGMLGSYSSQNSPTRSFESYLPSPRRLGQQPPPDSSTAHARNASYASGIRRERDRERGLPLAGKKSMPDLRTAKLNFTSKKASAAPPPELPPAPKNLHEDSFPSPMSLRKDSDSSGSSSVVRPFTRDANGQGSPTRAVPPVPSMAFERNSYFRRLSKLPAATISNTLPKALLSLIDSARSILFAMCQVYQSLEHYTLHAPDDRLKSVLRKVLDPASADMMQLINALDRFDVMSRKQLPPHAICRGVVESCRDTVASFGKAVGVLALQLKVLAAADDVRYLRSMLLMLYGATAEVAVAWQGMVPQIETIRPLLHPKAFPITSPLPPDYNNGVPGSAPALGGFLATEPPMPRPHSAAVSGGRTRARRHAGSFSSKDVEIGKKLPSYDEPPLLAGGVASHSHTPVPRAPKRQQQYLPAPYVGPGAASPNANGHAHGHAHGLPTPSASSISMAEGSSRGHGHGHSHGAPPPHQSHSRQGSQASLHASSSSASISSGPSTSSSPSIPAKGTSFLDLPTSSKTQVDKEALQAIQSAVDVAPTVWDMMEQTLGDALDADVRESLDRARAVTRRLADMTRSMQEGGDGVLDRRLLREDSNLFLKTVVQLSNVIKTCGGAHSTLRSNLVKLTNSTEEFAILLHVSSYSPLPTTSISYTAITHPHNHHHPNSHSNANGANSSFSSNAANANGNSSVLGLGPPEEYRVGSSLSRSRSAQPPASSKLAMTPGQEQPRSALPLQSFKVPPPVMRRGRSVAGEAG
ncbi:Leucine-rich repeat-containing protein SOG2 [Mycena venus]|uniref:Leucine-rich repeat-containing protein SOG2 n=1 Tax=Mycena venus TaxID=2733690 RepID=A0A8H6Y3T9_9AGAR|nr:Leucine-rich repeat-containing protein SOG2 [Mycena venus]